MNRSTYRSVTRSLLLISLSVITSLASQELGTKVLTIGSATQDVYMYCKDVKMIDPLGDRAKVKKKALSFGEKVEIDEMFYRTGGGATNAAVSFKRNGLDVSCFTKIGDDSEGKQVIKKLKDEGINTKSILVSHKHPTGMSFIANSMKGDHTIFTRRGANGFIHEMPLKEIRDSDVVYITSLNGYSSKRLMEIVSFAKGGGSFVAMNPGKRQLCADALNMENMLLYIDAFILNSSEAKIFMCELFEKDTLTGDELLSKGVEGSSKTLSEESGGGFVHRVVDYKGKKLSTCRFIKRVLSKGPSYFVITHGKHGAYVCTKDGRVIFHPVVDAERIDTVGAGDAFGSTFVGCLALGHSEYDALQDAIINSNHVIEFIGPKPGLLTRDQIIERKALVEDGLCKEFELVCE